jgi:hypothetical protein
MTRSLRKAALGAALAGAALGATPALSSAALPQTCLKDGVCFTKTFSGASTKLTVTGTPGNDTIVIAHVNPTSNNVGSGSISVNGKLVPGVNEGARLTFVVNALGGNDQITEQFPATTQPLYGSSTLDGGEGDDVITAAFRSDLLVGGPGADVLDGGAGDDQLATRDGARDVLHGGLGIDAAQSDLTNVDAIDGVETIDAQPAVGRVHLTPGTVRAKAGKATRLKVSWTHPTSWRELKMINLKIFDGATPLGNVYVRMSDQRVTGHGALTLVSSSLTRHGKTASARLRVRVPRSLAGANLRLAVEAADVHGHLQEVPAAGELRVAR